MSVLLFLLLFVPLSLVLAWWVTKPRDRALLIRRTALAWLVLAPLTAVMNEWMPFAGAGDDESYYELAQPPPASLTEAFDFSRFQGSMEQPGYPALLSLLNALVGHNLLAYKLLNLFFLITLSLVWYRIGLTLEGRRFARTASLVVLLLTPLWHYVFVLRKDMTITLLQSTFLLGVVQIRSAVRVRSIVLIALTSLGVTLLRSPLLLQQAGVLAGSVLARRLGTGRRSGSWLAPALLIVLAVLTLIAASNRELLGMLGIQSEARVASESMLELVAVYQRQGVVDTAWFPVIYLFTEISGLNPSLWERLSSSWARGVLALPWIILGVPCFLLGLRHLFTKPAFSASPRASRPTWLGRLRSSKALASPWAPVLLFALSYLVISWKIGETTRWRLPDMPMLAAIALVGWMNTDHTRRTRVLLWWTVLLGSLFGAFYLLRSL